MSSPAAPDAFSSCGPAQRCRLRDRDCRPGLPGRTLRTGTPQGRGVGGVGLAAASGAVLLDRGPTETGRQRQKPSSKPLPAGASSTSSAVRSFTTTFPTRTSSCNAEGRVSVGNQLGETASRVVIPRHAHRDEARQHVEPPTASPRPEPYDAPLSAGPADFPGSGSEPHAGSVRRTGLPSRLICPRAGAL